MDIQTQLHRLRKMLASVLETNAFYKQKLTEAGITQPNDVQTLDDYRQLPFTTKEELSTDQVSHPPYGTNLTFPLAQYTCLHRTSGTTGEPFALVRYSGIVGLVGKMLGRNLSRCRRDLSGSVDDRSFRSVLLSVSGVPITARRCLAR